jgi:hypothetical protein
VLDPEEQPVSKGALRGQTRGFNPQAATRVPANDKNGQGWPRKVVPLHPAPAAGNRVGSRPALPAANQRG